MKLKAILASFLLSLPLAFADTGNVDIAQFIQQNPYTTAIVVAVIFLVIGFLLGGGGKRNSAPKPKYRDHF